MTAADNILRPEQTKTPAQPSSDSNPTMTGELPSEPEINMLDNSKLSGEESSPADMDCIKRRQRNHLLQRAAEDCQVLIAYIARQPELKSQPDLIAQQDYVQISDRILGGRYSDGDEAKVWTLLQQLTKAAFPATAESIRDSNYASTLGLSPSPGRGGRVRLTYIWVIGTAAFFLTLFVGLYISITETVVLDSVRLSKEFTQLMNGQTAATRLEGAVRQEDLDKARGGGVQLPASAAEAEIQKTAAGDVSLQHQEGMSADNQEGTDPTQSDERMEFRQIMFDDNDNALVAWAKARDETSAELIFSKKILERSTFGLAGRSSEIDKQVGVYVEREGASCICAP